MDSATPREEANQGRVLVFDMFAGLGSLEVVLTRCLDSAWLQRLRIVAFETDPLARSGLARRHAGLGVELSEAADTAGSVGSCFALLEGSPPLFETYVTPDVIAILVTGGAPCVGFSRANPSGRGIDDAESQKLWLLPVLLARLRAHLDTIGKVVPILFLVENVEMSEPERDAISHTFGVAADLLDAGRLAAADRPRLVWSNVPASPTLDQDIDAQGVLEPGWAPAWTLSPRGAARRPRFRTFTRPFGPGRPREFPLECMHFSAAQYDERGLVVRTPMPVEFKDRLMSLLVGTRSGVKQSLAARKELAEWIHLRGGSAFVRPLSAVERERALGLPEGASASQEVADEWQRAALLGNTWSVPIFAARLAALQACLDGRRPPLAGFPSASNKQEALRQLTPLPGGGARRAEPSRAAGHCWQRA